MFASPENGLGGNNQKHLNLIRQNQTKNNNRELKISRSNAFVLGIGFVGEWDFRFLNCYTKVMCRCY